MGQLHNDVMGFTRHDDHTTCEVKDTRMIVQPIIFTGYLRSGLVTSGETECKEYRRKVQESYILRLFGHMKTRDKGNVGRHVLGMVSTGRRNRRGGITKY